MKIRIYQVNTERDSENLAFMGSDFLMKKQGGMNLDSSIYDSVFEGTVEYQMKGCQRQRARFLRSPRN